MTKRIYNNCFLDTKSILLLTKDIEVTNTLTQKLSSSLKKLEVKDSVYGCDYLEFDLLLIDIDFFDTKYLDNTFFKTKLQNLNIPVIYISSYIDLSLIDYVDNVPLKNIILKNGQLEFIETYISLIMKKNSKVYFNHDYSFCMRKKRFYFKEREIGLTNLEFKFIKTLLENRNKIVPYKQIIQEVWDGKECSIFSMRNVVNKIREKSYYEIIRNISNKGYIINDYKIY